MRSSLMDREGKLGEGNVKHGGRLHRLDGKNAPAASRYHKIKAG